MAIKKSVKSATKPSPAKATKAAPSGRSSLASLFDDTDMSEASNMLPEGEHEVRLNSFVINDKPGKGTAAFVEYESIDGEYEGKKVRQMYMLTEPDGAKKQGMAYLKRDLALLGYDNVPGKELIKTLETLTEEQPICIINVKNNGQYVNAYLQGLAENSAIQSDDNESPADNAQIEIGQRVKFIVDGEEVEGSVLRIKEESVRVKADDGEKYDVELDDLEIITDENAPEEAETEGETPEIVKGSLVTFDDDGVEKSGKVIKIKGKIATVEDEEGDKFEVDLSDLTLQSEEEEEEEVEIEVGARVTFTDEDTNEEIEGEVKSIKAGKATIEDDDGDRHKVLVDELSLAD